MVDLGVVPPRLEKTAVHSPAFIADERALALILDRYGFRKYSFGREHFLARLIFFKVKTLKSRAKLIKPGSRDRFRLNQK